MSLRSKLFKTGRVLSASSSILGDIEALASKDKSRIGKRIANKAKNMALYEIQKKTNIK